MNLITKTLLATAFALIALMGDQGLSLRTLKKLHDNMQKAALSKISQGLTPMSGMVKKFRGGELKDSWLKPLPPEELGSAMKGLPPMTPPQY